MRPSSVHLISPTRRRLLLAGGGLLGLSLSRQLAAAPEKPRFDSNPFTLGVASGEPVADGFVIWTRLAPQALADESGLGGIGERAVVVDWIVAEDAQLKKPVKRGSAIAEPASAHTLHIEISGLKPERPYWYAFRAGDAQSTIGRALTTPAANAPLTQLRFAYASCQHYENGFYAAYRHMVADDPQLILHLGDYIYEGHAKDAVRQHEAGEPRTLAEYRRRHACYKLDADLQRAHAHCPWLVTWDDHDVQNDYAGDQSEDGLSPQAFLLQRAAAYQAYWEHLPLRPGARPRGPDLQLYRADAYGDLLQFQVLDTRQYRSDQACATPQKLGGQMLVDCAEISKAARTMLGPPQERWLLANLQSSRATWNVLAQQLMMAPLDQQPGPGVGVWTDGWDGYAPARKRILDHLATRRIANPVVISGDIHSYWANDIHADGAGSKVLASEFVGSSISSRGVPYDSFAAMLPDNPHVKFFDSRQRGYVLCEVTPKAWRTAFRAVDDGRNPASGVATLRKFVVEAGRPGVQVA